MARNGLLIDYEYCTGCHSCEVSCKNEHNIPHGQWGIKLTEVGPFKINEDKYEWDYVPVPTSYCDLCEDRVAKGEKPACVLHCLGACMEYGPVEELAKKAEAKGKKVAIFTP
ncbi:Fe-S-cluster-containing dehydrogenase component [Sporomusaceae bacterium BoRhaA]|uniref:4Fe-4S dicluster domain-containing protein n=1 Tax=Pelorhabdus rhamnosifermentans TaxID=2772457 RepID=UPI001C063ADF|nr:4Fe-4S dicluster domain-containing protein [Pelorhabdus rhamnosifermentans]MBU2702336.1 Fe-S-cluster-containing dehydrogenase component [Pelorhabdus rhamnosifermentans]